ncbi:MAG: TatD family hydrolase [archaeon]|nr:TatD family hydrolase [Nanoarchaeota archaeon]
MALIDVHCHLNSKVFKDNLNKVLERAQKAGMKAIIISGTNPAANKQVLEIAEKYKDKYDDIVKVSLGIHPIDALGLSEGETGIPKQEGKVDLEKEFKFIEKNKDKILAIGEVGLDYHWDENHHEEQKEVFRKIVKFAVKIKKPLIIHTWKAEEDCLDILEEEVKGNDGKSKVPVVLHCFGGRKSLITRGKESGYYFTVPPSILKNGSFQALVKKVDLKQLLTETDAPWQSPERDMINEPANVAKTVEKIAEIKGISVKEAEEQIWKNYQEVFGNKN